MSAIERPHASRGEPGSRRREVGNELGDLTRGAQAGKGHVALQHRLDQTRILSQLARPSRVVKQDIAGSHRVDTNPPLAQGTGDASHVGMEGGLGRGVGNRRAGHNFEPARR